MKMKIAKRQIGRRPILLHLNGVRNANCASKKIAQSLAYVFGVSLSVRERKVQYTLTNSDQKFHTPRNMFATTAKRWEYLTIHLINVSNFYASVRTYCQCHCPFLSFLPSISILLMSSQELAIGIAATYLVILYVSNACKSALPVGSCCTGNTCELLRRRG
jgi:hypothetical protein